MRIAFTLFAGSNWLGGYNYLLNFCRVIGKFSDNRLTPVMFVGADVEDCDLISFREVGCEIVVSPSLNRDNKTRRLLNAFVVGRDTTAERLFIENRIDTVFEHATYFGWRFKLPTIAWLGDFQHKYFPSMFSKAALIKREFGMRLQIWSGRIIMVSSDMARRDCNRFFGLPADKVHVVRFSVPTPYTSELDLDVLRERYNLPRFFFHLPNQFWIHKNHLLVLKALTMLQDEDVCVVSTGRCEDLRHPKYFTEVENFIKYQKLENKFKVLGVVPYVDMVGLMCSSLAVINPSLFEGWSTTVEEARSLGVPTLLSDIPVHREQMGAQSQYFSVNDSEKLAALLDQYMARAKNSQSVNKVPNVDDNHDNLVKFIMDFEKTVDASLGIQ